MFTFMDVKDYPNKLSDGSNIKVEKNDEEEEDFNEFTKTTMKEMLGWYEYDSKRSGHIGCTNPITSCSQNGSMCLHHTSPKYTEECDWCGHIVTESKAISSSESVFCSELCFSQSRRANFKKNKICDWCRHMKHAISYVDFQDGASRLQFCSDKCLNQYKMNIFCRETRAHLEVHPHNPEESESTGALITPDLWFKDCPSVSSSCGDSGSPSSHLCSSGSEDIARSSPAFRPSKLHNLNRRYQEDFGQRYMVKLQRKGRKRTLPEDHSLISTCETPQDLRIRGASETSAGNLRRQEDAGGGREGGTAGEREIADGEGKGGIPFDCFTFVKEFKKETCTSPDPTNENEYPRELHGSHGRMGHVLAPLGGLIPPPSDCQLFPPVLLVPYPILVPLPLPIPLPFDSRLLKSSMECTTSSMEKRNRQDDNEYAGNGSVDSWSKCLPNDINSSENKKIGEKDVNLSQKMDIVTETKSSKTKTEMQTRVQRRNRKPTPELKERRQIKLKGTAPV